MTFQQNQIVVHPFHGPVRVTGFVTKTVRRTPRHYIELEGQKPALKISVPLDQVEHVGLREPASMQRVAQLFDILAAPSEAPPQSWARRMKDLHMRAGSGRLDDLCYVIREIAVLGPRPAASSEGMLLRECRTRLASEISISLRVSVDEAESVIDTAVVQKNAA